MSSRRKKMDLFGASTTLLLLFLGTTLLSLCSYAAEDSSEEAEQLLQTIEGKVTIEGSKSDDWLKTTFVSVDGGRHHGFLKANGEFEIHGVAPGSYLVEVVAENHVFEPARVDISSKSGRVRARKMNLLNVKTVEQVPYPLKFKTGRQADFFEKREPWSIINTLKNPMVCVCARSDLHTLRWFTYATNYERRCCCWWLQ